MLPHFQLPMEKNMLNNYFKQCTSFKVNVTSIFCNHTINKQFDEDKQTKTVNSWNHVLWSYEMMINISGSSVCGGEEYDDNCVLPTVKDGGKSVMVWDYIRTVMLGTTLHLQVYSILLPAL